MWVAPWDTSELESDFFLLYQPATSQGLVQCWELIKEELSFSFGKGTFDLALVQEKTVSTSVEKHTNMPLFFRFCWSFSSVYNFFLSHKYRSAFFLMWTVWTWKPVKHFPIHFLLTNNDTRRPFKYCDDCNQSAKHTVLFESCILYYVLFKMPIVCFCGHAHNRIRQKATRKWKTIIHLRLFVFKCFWNWNSDARWQSGRPWGQVIHF